MLIQSIQSNNNYQAYNRNNIGFKGELGQKVVQKMSESDNADVSEIMKNLGIGNMGIVSSSKVKDILEEIAKKNAQLNAKEKEFDAREKDQNEQIAEKQRQLDGKQKQLDTREEFLNKLEQSIVKDTREKETEIIRAEEQEKAYNELADKFTEIANTEAALDKREQALVSAESIMKQAEKDQLESAFRAKYGIKDPDVKEYASIAEQVVVLTEILNKNKGSVTGAEPQELAVRMRNNEGVMSEDNVKYLERLLKVRQGWIKESLCTAIDFGKDDSGNLDTEKSAHLLSLLAFDGNNIPKALTKFSEYYNCGGRVCEINNSRLGHTFLTSTGLKQYQEHYNAAQQLDVKIARLKRTADESYEDRSFETFCRYGTVKRFYSHSESERRQMFEKIERYEQEKDRLLGQKAVQEFLANGELSEKKEETHKG